MTEPAKRGVGRPRTRGAVRDKALYVRLTPGLYATLEARAEAAGKKPAETAFLLLEWALSTSAPSPLGKGLSRIE